MTKHRITFGTVIKLALASLVVGLVLAAVGVTPTDLLSGISGFSVRLWETARSLLGWAGSYMLLGALVVLPIWLGRYLWLRINKRLD